jgi:hypothetical protein
LPRKTPPSGSRLTASSYPHSRGTVRTSKTPFGEQPVVKSIYFEKDDILQIRVSDKPVVREVSQDWHTNISYADDGSIVEIVLLDAKKEGLLPTEYRKAA